MTLIDELPCLSPITDFLQMPSLNGDLFGMDMLLSSGDQVESYLSYAAHHVPLVSEINFPCTQVFKIKDMFLCSHQGLTEIKDDQL